MKQDLKLTAAKSSMLDCVVEDPVETAFSKEDVSVVKDLPCALNSMNELFGLSAALSTFSCRFNELQQHLQFIKNSIDNVYTLQTIREPEVVVTEPNASTSVSSAVTIVSSPEKMDEQRQHMEFIGDTIDNMRMLQNVKEFEVVATASEPKDLTSLSSGDPILSSDQMAGQSDNVRTCQETSHEPHNVNESEMVMMVPEPNSSVSGPSSPPVLSSPNPVVGSSDNGGSCKNVWWAKLEKHCINMSGCSLRNYIKCNLSDINQIREEAPTALMRAPNPAELVITAIGHFYLQTRRAYKKYCAHNNDNRQACLLILEFFLLSGCTSIEPSVQVEAEITAVSWRSRLLREGGYRKASSADARGLLLFIASYGIPSCFTNEDLMELIRLSNVWEISNALQRSAFLKERISDIIQEMVERKIIPGAVEAACSFGLEEKYHPETILSPFLQESKQAWERDTFSQSSPLALIEANQKHLDALKTVAKCLEDCKISPTKFEGWNINTKIANLEKVVSDLYRDIEEKGILNSKEARESKTIRMIKKMRKIKWKIDNYSHLKAKRPRTSNRAPSQMQNTFMLPQEQMTFSTTGGNTFYDGGPFGFTGYSVVPSATPSALSGAIQPDLHRTFPGNVAEASVGHDATWAGGAFHRRVPGNVAETSAGHTVGAGVATRRTTPAKVAETSMGHPAEAGATKITTPGNVAETSAGHAAGAGVATHRTNHGNVSDVGVRHNTWTGVACSRTSPGNVAEAWNGGGAGDAWNIKALENSTSNVDGSYAWRKDGTLNHNSTHDIKRHQTFFEPPASAQGFSRQPSTSTGAGSRSSGSDLYHFADSF